MTILNEIATAVLVEMISSVIWRTRFLGQVIYAMLFSHTFFLSQKIAIWFWFCDLDVTLGHTVILLQVLLTVQPCFA